MKVLLSFLVLICTASTAFSQTIRTISGDIQDVETGEKLIGATVYETRMQKGTGTNVYGFFSLSLAADTVELSFSYVGYQPQKFRLVLTEDTRLDVSLSPITMISEAVIESQSDSKVEESQMSAITLDMSKVASLPVLLGERDVLKTLQLLPGVQSGTEGASGIYVRGGGPDQNLILLDGVPVYNASHLFGFFSVFNSDAIRNVELIKGGFPARYGGRTSSVIDIRMKEGNSKEFKGEGAIGLISSKLTLEGPIWKDRTSFLVSGRRTYIDFLTRPIIAANTDDARGGYYFYDLNGKVNHKINDNNRLFLSMYHGKDRAYISYKERFSGVTE
ncbi:MAG: TonB-dependent receptor, partial [Flavobacteriales bacterium]|nr:TonB-dependent receptor [Flavobacteriales bacterium]